MVRDTLESQADALLRSAHAANDNEAPAYSERYIAARDRRRANNAHVSLSQEAFWGKPSAAMMAAEAMDQSALVRACHACRMTDEETLIVKLRVWSRLTVQEVADYCEVSKGYMSKRLSRLLARVYDHSEFWYVVVIAEACFVTVADVEEVKKSFQVECPRR
jgi:hypothetical protein